MLCQTTLCMMAMETTIRKIGTRNCCNNSHLVLHLIIELRYYLLRKSQWLANRLVGICNTCRNFVFFFYAQMTQLYSKSLAISLESRLHQRIVLPLLCQFSCRRLHVMGHHYEPCTPKCAAPKGIACTYLTHFCLLRPRAMHA